MLKQRPMLDPGETLWILRQTAAALDAAHQHGLVHRDVKPGNVLLDSERAYLSDFGLTKPATTSTPYTVPGQLVGTLNYVAPEQIRGDRLGPQADVYALASVLYECLAGEVPYPRESEVAALYAHLHDPPPTVTTRRPELPAAIDATVARGLAKDPAARQKSCGELMTDAHDALGGTVRAASEAPRLPARVPPSRQEQAGSITAAVTRLPGVPAWRARGARSKALLGVVLVLGVAGGALAFAITRDGHGPSPKPPSPKAGPVVPQVVTRTEAVGRRPSAVVVGVGGVWVANSGDGTVTRLDPVTGTTTAGPLSVGAAPTALAEHGHTVFVASASDSTLRKVDALSAGPLGGAVALGHVPRAIASGVGDGKIWVAAADGTVMHVEQSGSGRIGTIHVGGSPRGIATARGEAWVTRADGTVVRIDTRRDRIKGQPIPVGRSPRGIAVGDGVVWVANQGSGTVTRLSAHSGRTLGPPITVGRSPAAVAVGEGYVWVADSRDGSVVRLIPPGGARVGPPVRVGKNPMAIRTGAGAVWVANRGSAGVTSIRSRDARPRSR
jgi:DNA-binding beta-propeller fold protein YncE